MFLRLLFRIDFICLLWQRQILNIRPTFYYINCPIYYMILWSCSGIWLRYSVWMGNYWRFIEGCHILSRFPVLSSFGLSNGLVLLLPFSILTFSFVFSFTEEALISPILWSPLSVPNPSLLHENLHQTFSTNRPPSLPPPTILHRYLYPPLPSPSPNFSSFPHFPYSHLIIRISTPPLPKRYGGKKKNTD